MISDVSGVSERDAAHLRQLSDGALNLSSVAEEQRPGLQRQDSATSGPEEMVVSPPTADETPAGDYISARSSPGLARKPVFKEEDMDGDKQK